MFDRDEPPKPKPLKQAFKKNPGGLTNILDYVETTARSNHKRARCPACALEGRDLHHDNLSIFDGGFGFKCWATHTTVEIIQAVRR